MSVEGWRTILVLGGIRSGKSEFAESLVADEANVRYVATSTLGEDDPEWAERISAHRHRRPEAWTTEEVGADPTRLTELVSAAGPDETLLVDDLGGWVSALLTGEATTAIVDLAGALGDCRAQVVVVSPEVGLSLVPTTDLGRAFADTIGIANQAVAAACDAVVLVVAGQPTWLKNTVAKPREEPLPEVLTPTVAEPPTVVEPTPKVVETPANGVEPATGDALTAPTMALPMVATGLVIQPGMDLPMPDEHAGPSASTRLATLDVAGAGLGALERVVTFAAATQGTGSPVPWRSVRVLLLQGDHDGGAAAGTTPGESARRADLARAGEGALARLAAEAGASLQVVEAPTAAPMELGPALTADAVESALRQGWRLAEQAADSGVDIIVLAACGAGTEAAAAAVLAATAGAEPAAVLGRVIAPGGRVNDTAWMLRCAAVRDAVHRTRHSSRGAKEVLAELGGGDIAVATGVLLGATARRTPVLIDGPVGVAAGLVSRDLAGQARHWCLLPDHGGHPAVKLAADVLGLEPLLNLRLDLGEGATALAALPLLRAALTLGAGLPAHPTLASDSA
jgi:nicotinate-nucleotide--dimethylbenzimidazole phosphoribosyltransferase